MNGSFNKDFVDEVVQKADKVFGLDIGTYDKFKQVDQATGCIFIGVVTSFVKTEVDFYTVC